MLILPTTVAFAALTGLPMFAIASPSLVSLQNVSSVTFHVTDFYAFMADPYIDDNQSNMTFHVVDPRPEYYAEVDCVVPPTYFNLYAISALYNGCEDEKLGFEYSFNEDYLVVSRGWTTLNGTYRTGTAMQSTAWTEGVNLTTVPTGKVFTRRGEWRFPVTRA